MGHLLEYLHKQHPFKSIGFDIKAIQSCQGYEMQFQRSKRPEMRSRRKSETAPEQPQVSKLSQRNN